VARPKALARCPACNERRDVDKQIALRRVEDAWFAKESARYASDSYFQPLEGGMRKLACTERPNWFWACDECIGSGRARIADITKQQLGLGTPFAAYVDRPFRCEDCGKESIFGASEQQHWFEKLGFLIWVYPKQCPPCRAARRARKQTNASLAEALHGLDEKDPAQLEAVALLYEEMGATTKATEYRARAKNRKRPKNPNHSR
jgi:hypothetical protein